MESFLTVNMWPVIKHVTKMGERGNKLRNVIFQNAIWFSAFLSEIRYEVNFQNGIECGGAYVKLLSKTPELNLVGASYFFFWPPTVIF